MIMAKHICSIKQTATGKGRIMTRTLFQEEHNSLLHMMKQRQGETEDKSAEGAMAVAQHDDVILGEGEGNGRGKDKPKKGA